MAESLELGSSQFARILEILVAEQARLKRYSLGYRLQKAVTYFLAVALSLVLLGIGAVASGFASAGAGVETGLMLVGLSSVALVPLFVMNLPLAWKLFKQRRLRSQLGLEASLRDHFRAAGKKRRVIIVLAVLGAITALVSLVIIADAIWKHDHDSMWKLLEKVAIPVVGTVVGLSFPSLWLMGREIDRLEEMSRVRDRLASRVKLEDSLGKRIQVSISDYDRAAQIEKKKMLDDRERSIRQGAALAKASVYGVQVSDEVQETIERLDSKARLQVEEAIFGLTRKPKPKEARQVSPDRLELPVPSASVTLSYEVDREAQRIRIHELPAETPPARAKGSAR